MTFYAIPICSSTIYKFLIYLYNYVIRRYGILVPAGPRATGKRKAGSITSGYSSELDLSRSMFYKQALASVLRLTIRTTPVPYIVNAQRAATVRCGGKG